MCINEVVVIDRRRDGFGSFFCLLSRGILSFSYELLNGGRHSLTQGEIYLRYFKMIVARCMVWVVRQFFV